MSIACGIALMLLLSACDSPLRAQDSGGPLPAQQAAYDVTFYDLDVAVRPSTRTLEGRVMTHALVRRPTEVLVLNLDRRLAVTRAAAVADPSTALPVERRSRVEGAADSNEVWIRLPDVARPGDTLRIAVDYAGAPRVAPQPPWEGGFTWAETPDGQPWIATSCQTAGPDLWWPSKDHPSDEPDSMAIAVTVPRGLFAASNGVLVRQDTPTDTTETFRWRVSTSINPYTVALNIAPYARLDSTYQSTGGTDVPASLYVLPSDSSAAAASFPEFLDQVRFLEKTLGPYPFAADKYGVAQTPFLGMEHQTIIAYGHTFSNGGLGYLAPFDALHFHELAHEWYGNCLTVRDWKDFWLHEGTATYLEALYAENLQGMAGYHRVVEHFRSRIRNQTPVAYPASRSAQEMYGQDVYFKGAAILHTLRYQIGDEALRTVLRRFMQGDGTDGPACRHVSTADFVTLAEDVSGQQLDGFFSAYLYRAKLPSLTTIRSDDAFQLVWKGTGGAPFEVAVPVSINGEITRVTMTDGTGTLAITPTDEIVVDPDAWILRQ